MLRVFQTVILLTIPLAAQIQVLQPTTSGPASRNIINSNFSYLNGVKVSIFSGAGVPGSQPTSKLGDLYIDTTGNTGYQCFKTIACDAVATGNWQIIGSGGSGSVTSVGLTVPSWLSVTGSPVTSAGTLAVSAATGQTSHRVIGTCGSATSVSLCALVAGDIPTLNQNTTGNAATATALASTPAQCTGGQFATGITAAGVANCSTPGGSGIPGGVNGDLQLNSSSSFGAANINQGSDGSLNASKSVTTPIPSAPTFNSGGTTTCDLSASNVCTFTMTGNTTLAVTNPHGAGPYGLFIKMDGTGGRTVTYPGSFQNFCGPTPTASASTMIWFLYDGSVNYYSFACSTTDTGTLISGPTRSAPATPSSGLNFWFDSTDNVAKGNDSSGNVSMMPVAKASRTANQFVTNIPTTGIQATAAIVLADLPTGTVKQIAAGAKALATSAISSGACSSAQTATATGTLTTDVIAASFNADPTGVTGYAPSTSGMLTIILYPTADTVNFKVCNNTGSSITPGAITLNWAVWRAI